VNIDAFQPPTTDEALERLRMPMIDAMQTQRAVRRLHLEAVDMELLYELLELSLKAPSSSDTQDWCYIVVTGREQKARLGRLYRFLFRLFDPMERRNAAGDPAQQRRIAPGQWQAENFAELPAFVIPCYRRNLKHRAVGWPQISVSSFYGSVYPAVQNLLLACRAVGLGASLQTLPIWLVPAARRILGLPRNVVPVCVIPIGWAKGKYGPTTRPPIREVVHIDRYGNQPARG
jgi:nitroreductase